MPAPVIANASSRGNARYDVSGLAWDPARNAYVDDQGWHYDSNGLSLDRPDAFDPSKPNSDQFDEQTGTYSTGSGGGGGVGGYDGGSLLSNPYAQQALSQMQAESTADRSGVIADARRLLAQFGLIPQGFNDQLGILDDTTKKLIQANTDSGISQYARLLEGKQDETRGAISDLAARGLGRSGARGYKLRRGALNFDRNLSDAISAVLGNVEQGQSGYATRERGRQSSYAQFLAQLAQNWAGAAPKPVAPKIQFQAPPPINAQAYWASNPSPTYTNPATGSKWYGGFGGLESTKWVGKAADGVA